MGEQFAADLKTVFPHLIIQARSWPTVGLVTFSSDARSLALMYGQLFLHPSPAILYSIFYALYFNTGTRLLVMLPLQAQAVSANKILGQLGQIFPIPQEHLPATSVLRGH